MTGSTPQPLSRERWIILAALIVLAALAWGVLIRQALGADGDIESMGLTMGMSALLFLATWTAMTAAMMFPAAAPMILMFDRIAEGRRRRELPIVPTWVFVAGYLAVWVAFGLLAYGGALLAERLADRSMWLMDNAARLGGVTLLLAGIYQFTPLKDICLSKCRSPMAFVLNSWRDGYGGALRMGVQHGIFCLGCCWPLFVILFPLGVMNLAAMALLTILIVSEKSWPLGHRISAVAGAVLVAYGALVIIMPDALPGAM